MVPRSMEEHSEEGRPCAVKSGEVAEHELVLGAGHVVVCATQVPARFSVCSRLQHEMKETLTLYGSVSDGDSE